MKFRWRNRKYQENVRRETTKMNSKEDEMAKESSMNEENL